MRLLLAVTILLASTSSAFSQDDGFQPLFDGESLDGWVQHGGKAEYTIENEEIVGTSVPRTPNSFLCTEKQYGDFILELDFKVDPNLNSGIQIRSEVFEEPKTVDLGDGRLIRIPAGRVHGYQVEIDPSERAWSGGIYDEARRGWLYELKGDEHEEARKAFKQNEWNHVKVEAIGPHIRTWLNGVPAADLNDDLTPAGHICLQVHGIGKDESKAGAQVRWRNIKIKELSHEAAVDEHSESSLFFPGKDGPGKGQKVVLISGDEEYRSEEALPQLAAILAEHHGFDCTVLFSIEPESGIINPNFTENVPGIEALNDADLLVLFTRFRALPDDQMQVFETYLREGKPVLGLRTATHAFNFPEDSHWSHYSNGYRGPNQAWTDGFGRLVLGENWQTHHGQHKHQSTRGVIPQTMQDHPITRGIDDGEIWGSTDVYGVRLPLPGDSQPVVFGQVVNRAGEYDDQDRFYGMRPSDREPAGEGKNEPMMPILWTKSYKLPDGETGQAICSTIGSSTDLLNEGVRKVLVNSVYTLLEMTDEIPEQGANVTLIGEYEPTAYGFRSNEYWKDLAAKPQDFAP